MKKLILLVLAVATAAPMAQAGETAATHTMVAPPITAVITMTIDPQVMAETQAMSVLRFKLTSLGFQISLVPPGDS